MALKKNPDWKTIAAAAVFVLSLMAGYALSLHRPLWHDEVYTQVTVIDPKSYPDILFLRIKNLEGNNCPLFYLIQKGVSDLFQFRFPFEWHHEWTVNEDGSQVIMRLSSNFFMSLSMALLFYFFARGYSWGAGIYALGVAYSSFIVWAYWVEARPYALWFFLTTAQALVFLSFRKEGRDDRFLWTCLTVIHFLLSFTLILSAVQIVIVSALLWLYQDRNWRRYLPVTVIPVAICLFYYSQSMLYSYSLLDPAQLIFRNIPPDRILIILAYIILIVVGVVKARRGGALPAAIPSPTGKASTILFLSLFAVALLFLLMMQLRSIPGGGRSDLSERYFLYLTPIGITAVTLFSVEFIRAFRRQPWLLTNVVIVLGGLLVLRFLRTYMEIFSI